MDYMDIYKKCGDLSLKILYYYDLIDDLLHNENNNGDEIIKYIGEIKKLIMIESGIYSQLSIDEIGLINKEIKMRTGQNMGLCGIRIINRLAIAYDKYSDYTIDNNSLYSFIYKGIKLSIIDILNSKIEIDTYKNIFSKLNNLKCNNEESILMVGELVDRHYSSSMFKLCLHELSEFMMLDCELNLDELPDVDLKDIAKEIYLQKGLKINLKNLIQNRVYSDVITFIDKYKDKKIIPNDCDSIYDNLFYISYLEVLFSYLKLEQLENISYYLSKINCKDKMISNKIKSLIRRKINELD